MDGGPWWEDVQTPERLSPSKMWMCVSPACAEFAEGREGALGRVVGSQRARARAVDLFGMKEAS